MDFQFTKEQEMLRKEIKNFCTKELSREYVRWMDENCDFVPDELWGKMANLGFFAVTIPEEYGGEGLGLMEWMIVLEEISTASVATALGIGATHLGSSVILNLGTPEQKEKYLPRIAKGELKFALGINESACGTNILGTISTTTQDMGDHWLINGQKTFITSAHVADFVTTIAITDPDAKRSKGSSIFLVPRPSKGLETKLIPKIGCRATGTSEVFYNNVLIPKENIVGTFNNGWYELLLTLNLERIVTAMLSLGGAKAAFNLALQYAKEREAFGGPIGRFQIIQHYLADTHIEIENARNLIYKCAWLHDNGHRYDVEATMAKIVASKASELAAGYGMDIFAGYGFTMEYDMQRHFRDYRQAKFSPITNEMAKNHIAQSLGLPKS